MITKNFPLAWYAAKHWVDHARFGDVWSSISDGIDLLFDKNKPYFAAWLSIYDIDHVVRGSQHTAHPEPAGAVLLYYAVLCDLRGLVERLLSVHPQDVDAEGGIYRTPIIVALDNGHLDIALLLAKHGADGGKRGKAGWTGLYIASSHGYIEIVQALAVTVDKSIREEDGSDDEEKDEDKEDDICQLSNQRTASQRRDKSCAPSH